MSKIRINDLARELEVKSKSILDVLPEIGVTEKKSHSSSLEDHEADKVRARLRNASSSQASTRPSRPGRADSDEIKTKIDLSQISKPGDALKAIISKQQAPTATPPPQTVVPPPLETKPSVPAPPAVSTKPASPPSASPRLVVPTSTPRPTFTVPAPPTPPQSAAPAAPTAPVAPKLPIAPTVTPPAHTTSASTGPAVTTPRTAAPPSTTTAKPISPAAPPAPPPRMIVPQTGPRPVYKAPLRSAAPSGTAGAPTGAGAPIRPVPGRPVPGQPIFQRPRPGAPTNRPPLRPC